MSTIQRPLPKPTPETQSFWDGCRQGELRLQRCSQCAETWFPPRPFCPACACREVESYRASGRASLHSYVISHRPHPGFGKEPYAIAIVALEEGPRMMSNIVDCPQTPEALVLDMPLEVTFEQHDKDEAIFIPLFRPAGAAP